MDGFKHCVVVVICLALLGCQGTGQSPVREPTEGYVPAARAALGGENLNFTSAFQDREGATEALTRIIKGAYELDAESLNSFLGVDRSGVFGASNSVQEDLGNLWTRMVDLPPQFEEIGLYHSILENIRSGRSVAEQLDFLNENSDSPSTRIRQLQFILSFYDGRHSVSYIQEAFEGGAIARYPTMLMLTAHWLAEHQFTRFRHSLRDNEGFVSAFSGKRIDTLDLVQLMQMMYQVSNLQGTWQRQLIVRAFFELDRDEEIDFSKLVIGTNRFCEDVDYLSYNENAVVADALVALGYDVSAICILLDDLAREHG